MSKKLNKSGSNAGTPKNTILSYFSKSPAMVEKKKLPKTPSQETDPVGEKENVANVLAAFSPKSTRVACGQRNLKKEINKASNTKEIQESTKDQEDGEIGGTRKRKRIVIEDSDSSEDERFKKQKSIFSDSDDDDADADYKAPSDINSSESEGSYDSDSDECEKEEEEDEEDEVEESKTKKRKNKSEQQRKRPKLELKTKETEETEEVNDKRTVFEKLEAMQQINDDDNSKDNKDKFADIMNTGNDECYDEPVQWPHQKLEFLKPDKIKDKEGRRPDHPDYDPSTLYVPKSFLDSVSPGVRQWWVLKSDNFDCVLFFKVGKFYELYHMDADVGVTELGFTYMRGEFAHSGFPEVAFDKMASILVDRGYKIARVEQTETPEMMTERCKKTKSTKFDKVVRREICQITNRGTQVFGSQCEITVNHQPSYMLAIVENDNGASSKYGITFIDTSIGDFNIGEFFDDKNSSRLLTLLCHHMPVLVLYEKSSLGERTQQIIRTMLSNVLKETLPNGESQRATPEKTLKNLIEKYYVNNLPTVLKNMQNPNDNLGLTPHDDYKLALRALGICITYIRKCLLEEKVMPMARFKLYIPPDITNISAEMEMAEQRQLIDQPRHMVLDATTLTHLRITGEEFSLLSKLDHCCTKFGKRQLHHWICAPSCDCDIIHERQQAISELLENYDTLQEMRALFATLPDFERQLAQIHLFGNKIVAENHPDGRAIFFEEKLYNKKKLKNFISLLNGFKSLETSVPKLFKNFNSKLLRHLSQHPILAGQESERSGGIYPDMSEPLEFFDTAFNHSTAAETGVIAPEKGIDSDYDAAESKIEAVQKKLKAYLNEQEDYFGCRLSYFGSDKKRFQIEVPENKAHKATVEYQLEGQRKGSNPVKRYTTNATRDMLRQMQIAEDERNSVLKDLARRVFEKFSNYYSIWKECVDCISYLDVLGSLAEYAHMQPVACVPKVLPASSTPFIDIEEGYHPCMSSSTYIPNSILLGSKEMAPFSLLTGPNMGGKSTFMRQVGLLLVMAQIGAHVPAEKCEFTVIDRIFSRLGAQDDILAGQSTFMVEMSEASLILKHATIHSFVLMDELGRGTATYDGTAIAAAVVNYLAKLGCRVMFSTHYKHLTDNFGKDSRIQLGHMACMVENEDTDDPTEETVTFLYKYTSGACPKSYGFNAAKLAGMPHHIIKRAYELSKEVQAIALKRKINAKLIAAAVEKTTDGDDNGEANEKIAINAIKNLLVQLKSCQI